MLPRTTPILMLALGAGGIGCGGEPPEPTPPAASDCTPDADCERPSPSPYDPDLPHEEAAPSLSPDDAALVLPELLAEASSFPPMATLDLYQALLAHGDESCPGAYEIPSAPGETNLFWSNDCRAADGTSFYGYVQTTTIDRVLEDGTLDQGFVFNSGGIGLEMAAPDGTALRGATSFEYHTLVATDGSIQHYGYKVGDLLADEMSAAGDPWLRGSVGGTFNFYGYEAAGYRAVYYDGSYVVKDHPQVTALELHSFSVDDFACPLAALGSASLRDANGGWHDATFGPADELGTGQGCDPCADLTFGAESLGNFCEPDEALLDLIAWETTPW